MDPITTKATGLGSGATQGTHIDRAPKAEPSKFDKIREKMQSDAASPANPAEQATAAAKTHAPDAAARLDATKPPSRDIFTPHVEKNKVQLDHLKQRVDKLPKSDALDPLKKRLSALEQQQSSITSGLGKFDADTPPAEFLNMQMQVYQISEQIEMVTKVVDQLATGVKSILQTQV
jgi:hypothetical protein